jgi:2-keto-4-pentenoate hydratase/2-oxohepta-3-ene-1,7-dioic acid hydratase in catechol pathway
MGWVRYDHAGRTGYGILEGDRVAPVEGSPFESYRKEGAPLALSSVRLLPPVIPPTFYAAGINYSKHIKEAAALLGKTVDIPKKPDIGYRAVNALIGEGEAIVIPKNSSGKVQYEGELVAVIGRKAKHLSESEALSCVLGYTIGNDISERSWQASDRTFWRAKNTDTFKPMGPWIETQVDLGAMETIVRVNGAETTRFKTNDMLFGVATYISAMSRYLTLYPGDIIWMGTDGSSPDLRSGDVVEIDITGIGTLRNTFVAERP